MIQQLPMQSILLPHTSKVGLSPLRLITMLTSFLLLIGGLCTAAATFVLEVVAWSRKANKKKKRLPPGSWVIKVQPPPDETRPVTREVAMELLDFDCSDRSKFSFK